MIAYCLLVFAISRTLGANPCLTEDYCPPQPIKTERSFIEFDDTTSTFLDRDSISGCYCRLYPNSMGCFGRERCKKVPQKMRSPMSILSFHTTAIKEIRAGELDIFYNVSTLHIEQNDLLEKIEPGTFEKFGNLTILSISSNINMKFLAEDTFRGLENLTQLFLVGNGFGNIIDATVSLGVNYLPSLAILSLKDNNFPFIGEDAFHSMNNTNLEELNLVLCRVDYIHPDAFHPLKKLQALRLGLNSFNESVLSEVLDHTIKSNITVRNLNLYSAGFLKNPPKKLMNVIAASSISYLNLSKNRFEIISKDSFPVMPNIKVLDLADVLALNISKHAFSNLPNLKTLVLGGNKLTQLPEGVLLPNLTYLDLQQNSGSLFFSSYFSLNKSRFKNMKKLIQLNLGYNKLDALYEDTFTGLENLSILGLKNATIRSIKNYTFASLSKLELLNLENNYFVKNNPVGLEEHLFYGLDNLKVLLLGGNYISYLSIYSNPFQHLKSLVILDLSRNQISNLQFTDFNSLVNLQQLDLSNNLITAWSERVFINNTNLKTVILANNKLSYFSEALLNDLSNIKRVVFSGNSITCDCGVYSIVREWKKGNNTDYLDSIGVFCNFPIQYENWTIIDFIENVEGGLVICNVDDITTKLYFILPLLFLAVLVVCILFFLYYYRHHVRYWMFLTRLYLSRKGKIGPKCIKQCYTNYKYDAFVSYSSEDRSFVIRLVSMLENYEPYLKLCVYERDFEIGTFISESVLENVAISRKTVLVISDNYAKSQWCRWESSIAHHHKLFFENEQGEFVDDTLVLIKIGPVSGYHLTPTLKYLLKTRIYLQWETEEKRQKDFWEKLRQTLSPNKTDILETTKL